jgi:hypothetical protein
LANCAADEYAGLFAETGYFASGFRGHVVGRERLIAMVQSERQCVPATQGTSPPPRPSPTVVVDVRPAGVFGIADLGSAGHYEDEYVKTSKGWRFAGRTVITSGGAGRRSERGRDDGDPPAWRAARRTRTISGRPARTA